jgi:hypothetical protein
MIQTQALFETLLKNSQIFVIGGLLMLKAFSVAVVPLNLIHLFFQA